MAVVSFLSNKSILFASFPRPSAIRTSASKPLQNHPLVSKSNFSFTKISLYNHPFPTATSGRRSSSFNSSIKIAESDSASVDGEEDDAVSKYKQEGNGDLNHPPTLKTLIQVYKEAILDGDENTILDIEAMISVVESEKNDMVQKVSDLLADIASGKDKLLHLKADFENFRKRFENDRLTLTSDVQGEVMESLLPVVDNFERAKQLIKLETEKEKKINSSYQGIYKQFVEVMRSFHVAVVGTVGKPFDPSLHEAITREESHEFNEGIIIQEFQRGFFLGDRLLRPATVKVSSGPGPKKTPVASVEFDEQPTAAAGSDAGSAANR